MVYTQILHTALNVVLISRYNVTQWNEQQHCYLKSAGGEAGEICEVVSEQYLPKVNEVTLRREKLDGLLGHHIETETVTEILSV